MPKDKKGRDALDRFILAMTQLGKRKREAMSGNMNQNKLLKELDAATAPPTILRQQKKKKK